MSSLIVEAMSDAIEPAGVSEANAQPELTLAEQRSAVTRAAIIKATQTLLIEKHPAALCIPAVATQAGVSVRTVYRYFPNKQALLDGIANHFPQRSHPDGRLVLESFAENEAGLARLWGSFTENLPAVRAEHLSPAGAELRERRLTETRTQVSKHVTETFPTASEDDREQLTDMVIAFTSSSMFLELHCRLGRDADQAAHLAIWACKALFAEFQTNGLNG